jgi:hypothetical protein
MRAVKQVKQLMKHTRLKLAQEVTRLLRLRQIKWLSLTVMAPLLLLLLVVGSADISGIGGIAAAATPAPAPAATAPPGCTGSVNPKTAEDQVQVSLNETGSDCSDTQVTTTISAAVNILSYLAGILAIIMIILSGFRYITSAGDSSKVSAAKNTLIYALIGVVIAALAQLLVRYVMTQASTTTTQCTVAGHTDLQASDPNCK